MPIHCTCAYCGDEFPIRAYRRLTAKFCSRRCLGLSRRIDVAAVIWGNIRKTDGCWPYMGNRDSDGYGQLKQLGKHITVHRWVYESLNGPIPDGLILRHTCDIPPCCRPDHLITGTHADNAQDKVDRLRSGAGEKNGRAVLTADDVRAIRTEYSRGGITQRIMAKRYGVTRCTITAICDRRLWKHI